MTAFLRRAATSLGPFFALFVVVALFAYAFGELAQLPRVVYGTAYNAVLDLAGRIGIEFGRPMTFEGLTFLSQGNLRNILNQSAIVGIVSVGMTLVIVGGGIDLSVGSIVALAAVTVALTIENRFPATFAAKFLPSNAPLWSVAALVFAVFLGVHYRATRRLHPAKTALWGILWVGGCWALAGKGAAMAAIGGAFIGLAFGHLNGLLVGTTGVAPFIVTLGAMGALRGFTERLAGETKINVSDLGGLMKESPWLFNLMSASDEFAWIGLVPPSLWVLAAVALLAGLLLNATRLGRWILAVGANEEAARLSGVPTAAVKLWMYSLAGLLAGVGGVLQFARLSGGDPAAGQDYALDAVAAVVIGGGSLRGGEGSVLGAILGTLLMGVLRNGCQLLKYPTSLQSIIIGCIIIAAVTLDEMRHRNRRQ